MRAVGTPLARAIVVAVVVLFVWLAALVVVGLALGIVAFGLAGQLRRLTRAAGTAQGDVLPRVRALTDALPGEPSTGRHSIRQRPLRPSG